MYDAAVEARPGLDEQIRAWVLDRYRRGEIRGTYGGLADNTQRHLQGCPDATVTDPEWYTESGGCGTCHEGAHLEAVVSCPHGLRESIWYAAFGDMPEIIAGLDAYLAAQDNG